MTVKSENPIALASGESREKYSNANAKRTKKKRKQRISLPTSFHDLYKMTGEELGEGSYGRVETCVNLLTGVEYAVKIIQKTPGTFIRSKLLKEIEVFHICRGHPNIIQLVEYFEEEEIFYLVFEKINGGSLLNHIQRRTFFSERETREIIFEQAKAIQHLHDKGIAHRDIKPENVLCLNSNSPFPLKLCDLDQHKNMETLALRCCFLLEASCYV